MFSSALVWLLTIQEAPQSLAASTTETFRSRTTVILAIALILLLTGMFLDMAPAILLLTPVLLPLVAAVEMDPVHLGLIMVTTLAIGLCTPPFGTTLYVSASIGKVSVVETTQAQWPFSLLAGLGAWQWPSSGAS